MPGLSSFGSARCCRRRLRETPTSANAQNEPRDWLHVGTRAAEQLSSSISHHNNAPTVFPETHWEPRRGEGARVPADVVEIIERLQKARTFEASKRCLYVVPRGRRHGGRVGLSTNLRARYVSR